MTGHWLKRLTGLKRIAVFGVLAGTLWAGALPAGSQGDAYPELDPKLEPLKSRFNADAGKVRLILILDPT